MASNLRVSFSCALTQFFMFPVKLCFWTKIIFPANPSVLILTVSEKIQALVMQARKIVSSGSNGLIK